MPEKSFEEYSDEDSAKIIEFFLKKGYSEQMKDWDLGRDLDPMTYLIIVAQNKHKNNPNFVTKLKKSTEILLSNYQYDGDVWYFDYLFKLSTALREPKALEVANKIKNTPEEYGKLSDKQKHLLERVFVSFDGKKHSLTSF